MKLTFFLIAFCLVFLRVYYSWSGHDSRSKGEFTVTITSNYSYEQVKHGGNIMLTDDETSIKSMAPGAYFRYKKDDKKFIAESNLEGEINYQVNNGYKTLTVNGNGKKLEAEGISEMIAYGFDASSRAERIYKKGGHTALLQEADKIKNPDALSIYLTPLLTDDSLSQDEVVKLIQKTGSSGPEKIKMANLKILAARRLKTPEAIEAYFEAVGSLGSEADKVKMLTGFINEDTVSEESFNQIVGLIMRLGSDFNKKNLLNLIIKKEMTGGDRFDKILDAASHFGSDMDKGTLYHKLIETNGITTGQWIVVIDKTAQINAELNRANLLVAVAAKMPKTENTKSAYLNAAKTIHAGSEYARVMKAIK